MNILNDITNAGLNISLVGDQLRIANPEKLNDSLRDLIRANKSEIVKYFSNTQLLQDIRERTEERSTIMEFDGCLSRQDADVAATNAMRVYCYRVTDKPESELVTLKPNVELAEATKELKERYGDRLLSVTPMTFNQTKH
jgi:hypothetical protein